MGAGSRFDQPLTLIQDGHKVVACGPLGFHGCEVRAEVSIDLKQPGNGKASATGIFVNTNVDEERCNQEVGDDEDEWMLTAIVKPHPVHGGTRSTNWSSTAFAPTDPAGSGQLVIGHGVITYRNLDGTIDIKRWHQDDLKTRWQ
jgi:hypothetical protein